MKRLWTLDQFVEQTQFSNISVSRSTFQIHQKENISALTWATIEAIVGILFSLWYHVNRMI